MTSSHTGSRTETNTIGGGTNQSETEGKSGGTAINYAHQTGTQYSNSLGLTYTINYTPQIIPRADPAELVHLLNQGDAQLLIVRD